MNVSELEEQLLRAARRDLAPGPADRERHRLALLEGARAGALVKAAGRPASAANWGVSHALSIGLLIGALMGGGAGYMWGQKQGAASASVASVAPASPAAAKVAEHRTAQGTVATATPPSAEAEVNDPDAEREEPAPPAAATEPSEPADAPSSRRAAPAARRAETREAPSPSSVSVELAMLQRARRALNANNGRLALGLVQELDERFPNGLLLEERQATRILSLCELGRIDEARRAASQFEQRYPGSVYGERVRSSCAFARGE